MLLPESQDVQSQNVLRRQDGFCAASHGFQGFHVDDGAGCVSGRRGFAFMGQMNVMFEINLQESTNVVHLWCLKECQKMLLF